MLGLSYIEQIERLIRVLRREEINNIERAADFIAEAFISGHRLHVFGTGHSHMLAEEVFYRAGGLANVNPILHDGFMLHHHALQSTELERLEGLASIIFADQNAAAGDVMIIASNSGRNPAIVEMALAAKQHGLTVIAITNMKHSRSSASRHSSGKRLFEVSDVVIDNHGHEGDASIFVESLNMRIAPTSTVVGALIMNTIVAESIERMLAGGHRPDLFISSNVDGGDQINRQLIQKYRKEIRAL